MLQELPYNKQIRLNKLVSTQDKYLSLSGLQLLKRGMHDLGFEHFSLSKLDFSPHSKPRYEATIDFSIAHSGELVVCAISQNGRVGIDIEQYDAHYDLHSWTQKEAVLKAYGRAGIEAMDAITLYDNKAYFAGQQWYPQKLDLDPGYISHLMTEHDNPTIHYYRFD